MEIMENTPGAVASERSELFRKNRGKFWKIDFKFQISDFCKFELSNFSFFKLDFLTCLSNYGTVSDTLFFDQSWFFEFQTPGFSSCRQIWDPRRPFLTRCLLFSGISGQTGGRWWARNRQTEPSVAPNNVENAMGGQFWSQKNLDL